MTEFMEKSITNPYDNTNPPASNENTYIPFLQKLIKENNVKTVVDLGCADFLSTQLIYDNLEDVSYTGYDAFNNTIEPYSKLPKYKFHQFDFYSEKEKIIGGDLCILKDILYGWPVEALCGFFEYLLINKKFKYILLCHSYNLVYRDNNNGNTWSLSCDNFPLYRYCPLKLYKYQTNEVSIIFA